MTTTPMPHTPNPPDGNVGVLPEADRDTLLRIEGVCVESPGGPATRATRSTAGREPPRVMNTRGPVRLLDDLTLDIRPGETLALLGETGSGKSLLAAALAGLLPPTLAITSGTVRWASGGAAGGRRTAMVFQHPMQALNPVRRVGRQLDDALRAAGVPASGRQARALSLLHDVALDAPGDCLRAYPHMLSGGMCQRVLLALALASAPRLLIADEPTTGLDTVSQARVLDMIGRLAREKRMAVLLITHDLAMAVSRASRIAVMHAGQIVEIRHAAGFPDMARHPYTRRLIASTPRFAQRLDQLTGLAGHVPDLRDPALPACRFQPRCTAAIARCVTQPPPIHLSPVDHGMTRCWHPPDSAGARDESIHPAPHESS